MIEFIESFWRWLQLQQCVADLHQSLRQLEVHWKQNIRYFSWSWAGRQSLKSQRTERVSGKGISDQALAHGRWCCANSWRIPYDRQPFNKEHSYTIRRHYHHFQIFLRPRLTLSLFFHCSMWRAVVLRTLVSWANAGKILTIYSTSTNAQYWLP